MRAKQNAVERRGGRDYFHAKSTTMSGGGRKPVGDDAEVEALLRAAQDAVLLKLQANSHLVSSSSSAASNPLALDEGPGPLDDDLARRLDALRSRPPAPKRPDAAPAPAPAAGGMDEMEARFAALKGAAVCPEKETRVRLEDLAGKSDEVEKVMRWAMDAARLDVATAGSDASNADHKEEEDKSSNAEDKEEEDKSSASSEEDEEERLELEEKRKEEMMSKKNKAKSRWFFF